MQPFKKLLQNSVKSHGHLCSGQVIGVRMAMLGCHLVGIKDPKDKKFDKKLIVYVEIARCTADAIASVTGCQLGKRTLKFMDFGINAATFVNLNTHMAYRIVSTESSRDFASIYASNENDPKSQQIIGYQNMPDSLLFDVQQVQVSIPNPDIARPPRRYAVCDLCGQKVRDGKEVQSGHKTVCPPCSENSYFKVIATSRLSLPDNNYRKKRNPSEIVARR